MAANDLKDLFRHELGDIYDAEQQILSVLDRMETQTQDGGVRDRIRQHREETRHQIQNLEQCFELLGTSAPRVQCGAVRGLREEKTTFEEENPSAEALELFNLDAASKTEHYEVASYRGLIDQARALDQDDIERLLRQNLEQEESMRDWIEGHHPAAIERLRGRS